MSKITLIIILERQIPIPTKHIDGLIQEEIYKNLTISYQSFFVE